MRTTLNLDDLLAEAQRLTGWTERTALVREALRALSLPPPLFVTAYPAHSLEEG